MAKNIHQYGPVTRSLIKLAEGMRLVNLHLVLASNSNLSRIFNNVSLTILGTLSTGPASRLLCGSIGRFFGGALLAFIFGTLVPVAADATGHPSEFDVNVGGDSTVRLSMTSIGILMFILATPTLMVQGLAELVARVEGWDGSMTKQLRSDSGPSFAWN